MDEPSRRSATTDVCIVGAGPAGLTVAWVLAAAGRRVTVLESGTPGRSAADQELNDGDCEGAPYHGLQATRHRGIGGTANIWNVETEGQRSAKYVPLDDRDVEGWPLSADELAHSYREAQEFLGLGPFDYGAERWATRARRPFDLGGTGLASGVYHFGPADLFTRRLPARLASLDSADLRTGTTVVGLDAGAGGRRVSGVRAVGTDGAPLEVRAGAVVLAAGAVENARLLLLARRAGVVAADGPTPGRGLMEHARDFSLVLVPASPDVFTAAGFYDAFATAEGQVVGGRVTLDQAVAAAPDLPAASLTLIPRRRPRGGPLGRLLGRRPPPGPGPGGGRYGWSGEPRPGRAFDVFRPVLNLEQRPDPANAVGLSTRTDRYGTPLPRFVLRWSEAEQARLERLRAHLRRGFREAGIGELRITPGAPPDLNAHHHAGTTPMGTGPGDGVVDAQGRVFGAEGLYCAGASVFPTAGFANPTLTIVALAIRLARHLDEASA